MAPEIRKGKYNGKKVDIFSAAVVLFIIVKGNFPFVESKPEDHYYQLINKKLFNLYWNSIKAEDLSDEFKDLFQNLINPNQEERLSLEQIKKHPWMLKKTK